MNLRADRLAITLVVSLLGITVARPGLAGGFAVFDQDAHGAGMGGAFTAMTGNPSSLFYNVGASAFFKKKAHQVGVVHRTSSDFTFEDMPAVGVPTVFEQQDPSALLYHAYTIHPVKPFLNLGLAVYSPFDFENTWSMQEDFPGRTISTSAELDTLDAVTTAALRIGEKLGIGAGLIYRSSEVTTSRRLQTEDPQIAGSPRPLLDFASLSFDSGQNDGLGWSFGILHQPSERFSWGVSYRSKIEIDYAGGSLLTQIPTGNPLLDQLLALTNPFGQDLPTDTRIEFPDVASFGVAVGNPRKLLLALDVNRTGWSSFQELDLEIAGFPNFSQTIAERFDDAFSYRLGLQVRTAHGSEFRAGYAVDESPQPDDTVGPFFYDAQRSVVSLGFGRDWLDIALQWVTYEDRGATFALPQPPLFPATVRGEFTGEALVLTVSAKKKKKLPI